MAVSLAIAVTGCLIATPTDVTHFELLWPLLFLGFAIEEEVRTFEVPIWWGTSFLIARIGSLALTAGTPELLQAMAGAIVAFGLLLPLYGHGLLRPGTWLAGASFGAIVGIEALPVILALAVLFGVPFAAIRVFKGACPTRLPVFTAIGFGTAALPFLGLV